MSADSLSPPESISGKKNVSRNAALTVGWVLLTSALAIFLASYLLDGILRNTLEDKERELLSSRYLTVRMTYTQLALPGVQKLLFQPGFAGYYLRLTGPKGDVLLEQNPKHVHFSGPSRPMPTLEGNQFVPDWQEARSDDGLDFDLLSHRLHDGSTLLMGLCERSQESFFRHIDHTLLQISGVFLGLGLLGAFAFFLSLRGVRF